MSTFDSTTTAAPMAHTILLLLCSAGRTPTVTASVGRPGEARLVMETSGAGYGASVVLVGPAEILVAVVADLAAVLEGLTG